MIGIRLRDCNAKLNVKKEYEVRQTKMKTRPFLSNWSPTNLLASIASLQHFHVLKSLSTKPWIFIFKAWREQKQYSGIPQHVKGFSSFVLLMACHHLSSYIDV